MVDVASPVRSPVADVPIATTSLIAKDSIDTSSSAPMTDSRPISTADITTSSIEVISLRKIDGGFGLNIIGGTDSPHFPEVNGIFISHIKPGGAADICGKLVPGDEIIALNNVSITGKAHDEVVNMFANCDEFATLVVDHASEHRILKSDETNTIMGSITGARSSSRGSTTTVSNLFSPPPSAAPIADSDNHEIAVHVNGFTMKESISQGSDQNPFNNQHKASPLYRSHLHATSSFGSVKADADSTGWPNPSERDDDEMSTVTDASSHFNFTDDIPPTPKRPYSILDGDSPYAGVIYGCVGVAVICLVGYFVVRRIQRRGHHSH